MTMRLLFVLLLALLALPARAEHLTFPPFDQAAEDPSLVAFRTKLIAAVEKRDVAAVVAMSAPNVELSFGGDSGRETLRTWLTDNPFMATEEYWMNLERVLKEGGGFEGDYFFAPWSYFLEAPADFDLFVVAVVGGTNVRLRAKPTTDGAIIRALTYEVVTLPDWDPDVPGEAVDDSGRRWTLVNTLHGEQGWIASSFLRFITDYRAGFEKRPQGWQMIFFVAGD